MFGKGHAAGKPRRHPIDSAFQTLESTLPRDAGR
jgi:hypothetical protein